MSPGQSRLGLCRSSWVQVCRPVMSSPLICPSPATSTPALVRLSRRRRIFALWSARLEGSAMWVVNISIETCSLFSPSLQDPDRARAFQQYYEGDFNFSCQTFPQRLLADCEQMITGIFNNEKKEDDITLEPEIERAAIRYAEYDWWLVAS